MLEILITVIIVMLIAGLIWWLISYMPIPAPFKQIIQCIVIIICIIYLLMVFFGHGYVMHLNL